MHVCNNCSLTEIVDGTFGIVMHYNILTLDWNMIGAKIADLLSWAYHSMVCVMGKKSGAIKQ